MPNQQINSITSATTTDGSELLPVVSGGVTKSVSVSTINSGIAADAVSDVYEARDLAVGQSSIAAAAALAAGSIAQQDLTAVSAALHRSPNAVTSMFVYDTSKDSDGGAWTERCQHTSWYNETLNGKWLGAWGTESDARILGAATLGPERIPSGTFETDPAANGWSNTTSTWSGNALRATFTAGGQSVNLGWKLLTNDGLVSGKTYKLQFEVKSSCLVTQQTFIVVNVATNDAYNVSGNRQYDISGNAAQTLTYYFVAPSDQSNLKLFITGISQDLGGRVWPQTLTVDNVSIKEVTVVGTVSSDYYQSTADGKFYRLWKNILKYSNDFTNSSWSKYNTNIGVTPIDGPFAGTISYPVYCSITGGSNREILQSVYLFAGVTYCFSGYVKNGSQPLLKMGTSNYNNFAASLNASTGDIANVSGSIVKSESVGNGWYRFSMQFTANTSVNSSVILGLGGQDVDADPTDFFYAYGLQLEVVNYSAVASPTSYEAKTTEGSISEVFRGNKREFPKLSAVVAEASNVTIYDLTEPGRPMWMRFTTSGSWTYKAINGLSLTGISSVNSTVAVTHNGNSGSLSLLSFAGDSVKYYRNNNDYSTNVRAINIAARQATTAPGAAIETISVFGSGGQGNAVAMTVLPDAPVDPVTGLQVPTIAVATAGGVSVIKHNGTVASSAEVVNFSQVTLTPQILSVGGGSAGRTWRYVLNPGTVGSGFLVTGYVVQGDPSEWQRGAGVPLLKASSRSQMVRTNTAEAMLVFRKNQENAVSKAVHATITNTYNTGHMVGDIRRTYLADTAVGSVYSPALTMQNMITTAQQGVWYDPSDINLTWRKNLLTYSEQFDNAAWTKSNVTVTANAVAAPDGTTTAELVTPDTSTNVTRRVGQLTTASGAFTYSFYVKANGYTKVGIWDYATTGAYAAFDCTGSGSVLASGAGASAASIIALSGGWYRVSVAATVSGTVGFGIQVLSPSYTTGSVNETWTANGTDGIYIWGAQLELGSTATTYQKITDGVQDYLTYQSQPVMFTDAAGTTPVTAVEQQVGLMLDKSKGLVLGSNIQNGNFDSDTVWTKNGWVIAGGVATSSVTAAITQISPVTLAVGDWVKVTVTVSSIASGYVYAWVAGGISATCRTAAAGTFTWYFNITSVTDQTVGIYTGNGPSGITIDNVSIQRLSGNHAFQPTAGSRPVLSARYNLLRKTEQFDDAYWEKSSGNGGSLPSVTADYEAGPYAGTLADRVQFTRTTTPGSFSQLSFNMSSTLTVGATYIASIWMKSRTGSVVVDMGSFNAAYGAYKPTVTTEWQRFSYQWTVTSASSRFGPLLYETTGTAETADLLVWGADLRVANDALNMPAYQRVNTDADYDTVGFKPYLKFNGSSQWMQTNSIDFTATDKMFVSAGVRKLSDTTPGIVSELSTVAPTTNGAFYVAAPDTTGTYGFGLRGTSSINRNASGYTAPSTNVLSASYDIAQSSASSELTLRINGTVPGSIANGGSADAGTGNYGNYPLYIGARAGSSLYFNGRLYQLVIVNKTPTADELKSTETTINRKTLAYAEQ